jgi:hypothetical protein
MRIRTIARTHLALTSSRPRHTRCHLTHTHKGGDRPIAIRRTCTPLVGALALHGVSGRSPEATWAQPLYPGKAVLTWGVSRRSGSVACIHADASPNEVLAYTSWHRKPSAVNCRSLIGKVCVTPGTAGLAGGMLRFRWHSPARCPIVVVANGHQRQWNGKWKTMPDDSKPWLLKSGSLRSRSAQPRSGPDHASPHHCQR